MTHYHLSSRTVTDTEFLNIRYEDKIVAALEYMNVAGDIARKAKVDLTVNEVVDSFETSNGMYFGTSQWILVVYGCEEDNCISFSWN